ncbi:adenosylcobinamide hydrolase [Gemmobacter aquatilis]|uniref:Adenosylcobinamide hydrolase n=1 Tax=Gemmobacter aquatilis TaxID=933059 RepID=A0A1H8DNT8_9RHOB|nr:adenosylcobinamide amidohydrolase [Gemmobacter aquatilis]SEN08900.1 adenosylcobinamide hydrolase [Gemmobacter aquatilis]
MIETRLVRPWLIADLGAPRRVLSFAPYRPGFAMARHIVWREVRNADLTPDFDAEAWFAAQMAQQGWANAVGMLTSRDIGLYKQAQAQAEDITVACLATVGLGNAEAVGARRATPPPTGAGTINIAVLTDAALTETAQIEALTIAAEARTAAVLDSGLTLPDGSRATGTGTDCIALAAPPGAGRFAGLHTALGEALGRAVRQAVLAGAREWVQENGSIAKGYPQDAR